MMDEGAFDILDSSSERYLLDDCLQVDPTNTIRFPLFDSTNSSFEEPLTSAQQHVVDQLKHQPSEANVRHNIAS
jgi:hypothetical protein